MTKEEQMRVDIAGDVLSTVVAKPRFHVSRGYFVQFLDDSKECKVCAIGAAVCAITIRKHKSIERMMDQGAYGLSEEAAFRTVMKYFSPLQAACIEAAFEQGNGATQVLSDNEWHLTSIFGTDFGRPPCLMKAVEFGQRFTDDTERLTAIMQNIIENDGYFLPGEDGQG